MGSNQQYANAIDEMIKKRKEKGALISFYLLNTHPPPLPPNTHTHKPKKKTKVFY